MAKNKLNVWLLWSVKITAAIFNAPSTGYVFWGILEKTDRANWLVLFNTLLAVLLIDLFFLWVLTVLEDSTLDPLKRLPMAVSSIGLSVAIIAIGIKDEGILSYAPRIGLLALVFNDLVGWSTEFWAHYNSREQIEQRLRNRLVIQRRRMEVKTQNAAVTKLEPYFEERHVRKIMDQLGMEDTSERSETTTPQVHEESIKELPEHVFVQDDGTVGWRSPITGQLFTETKAQNPYTIRGAQIAASRHIKEHSKNGHVV